MTDARDPGQPKVSPQGAAEEALGETPRTAIGPGGDAPANEDQPEAVAVDLSDGEPIFVLEGWQAIRAVMIQVGGMLVVALIVFAIASQNWRLIGNVVIGMAAVVVIGSLLFGAMPALPPGARRVIRRIAYAVGLVATSLILTASGVVLMALAADMRHHGRLSPPLDLLDFPLGPTVSLIVAGYVSVAATLFLATLLRSREWVGRRRLVPLIPGILFWVVGYAAMPADFLRTLF